jgi:hypothetical protein
MPRRSFEEIREKLGRALELCRNLGLDPVGSRFEGHQQRLDHLVTVARLSQQGVVVGRNVEQELQDRGLEYVVALTESTELGDLLPFIQTCDATIVRRKLLQILTGPPLPSDEDPNSNQSRNVLFELSLAAKLHRAGLAPMLADTPDVACQVLGKQLYFECKRPFSSAGVAGLIRKAVRQLARDTGRHVGARGVVAVSFSKIMNAGDRLFVFSGEAEGRHGLRAALGAAAELTMQALERELRAKKHIVGVLFHVITPAVDRAADLYFVAQELHAWPLARQPSLDDTVFTHLGHALQKLRN